MDRWLFGFGVLFIRVPDYWSHFSLSPPGIFGSSKGGEVGNVRVLLSRNLCFPGAGLGLIDASGFRKSFMAFGRFEVIWSSFDKHCVRKKKEKKSELRKTQRGV